MGSTLRFTAAFLGLSFLAGSSLSAPLADEMVLPRSFEALKENSVLLFSGTEDWRHDSGIAGAAAFWARETDKNGTGFFTTENPEIFNSGNLHNFSVVVFNSMTGDVLNAAQKRDLQRFVESGGGLIIHHGGGDGTSAKEWPWYKKIIGTEFVSHPMDPQIQEAFVVTLAPDHPVMSGLKSGFLHSDEWYTFAGPVQGDVIVLAGLDESTYSPVNNVYGDVSDLRMGEKPSDHPIIWAKCPGEGRVVYSALGHNILAYESQAHQYILRNAMAWVRKESDQEGRGCPD